MTTDTRGGAWVIWAPRGKRGQAPRHARKASASRGCRTLSRAAHDIALTGAGRVARRRAAKTPRGWGGFTPNSWRPWRLGGLLSQPARGLARAASAYR